jgi:hypothetical protein
MFTLDGRTLQLDTAFEHNGIQYPANWLRLVSPEEREAIGIEEVSDPEPYDQRFYWGPGNPMDHAVLMGRWIAETRATAGKLLAPTDWMVIREVDNGTAVDLQTKAWREQIRVESSAKVALIEQTADTNELAELITGSSYREWPAQPA